MTLITLKDLEAHLWHAAHIITGPIDTSDYKTYIFPILFFKRICDVYDEEFTEALAQIGNAELTKGDMFHRIQIPEQCHWQHVFSPKDIGQALKEAFRGIELANEHLHGIFGDAGWTNKERLSDELPGTLLNHFNKVNLGVSSVRDDDMGRTYEYLIKRFADKANDVVLPHGVLFRGGAKGKIRTQLLEENRIEAIIGLAPNLLYGTGIPACILVLRKQRPGDHQDHVLIINAEEIYTKGRAQNTLSVTQADQIYHLYQSRQQQGPDKAEEIEGVALWVNLTEIKENDFNLNIARYVQKPLVEETTTVEQALLDFKQKLAALEQAEQELEELLIKEGFEI